MLLLKHPGIEGFVITNKMHIIMDHVHDYIVQTGNDLGKFSDQGVVAFHQ